MMGRGGSNQAFREPDNIELLYVQGAFLLDAQDCLIYTSLSERGILSIQYQQMTQKALARIRRFKRGDINKIFEIEEQAFPKSAYSRGTFIAYANSLPDSFIVVETGTDIVGYMIFDVSGHIHSTAVRPPYRRKGFGKMLFTHALKCIKKRPWLEVRSKNSGAIKFYKGLGMKIMKRIPNYYGSDDALVMVLGQKQ